MQHLLHPDIPGREEFAKFYFGEKVLGVVGEILFGGSSQTTGTEAGTETETGIGNAENLVMELFNLLVAPETKDFQLRWHRDDVPDTVPPETEQSLLEAKSPNGRQSHAQYNFALTDDESLIVIPGSHRRVRTQTERDADPYEPYLPGQVIVKLKPGDAVFYDSNILHRGVYRGKKEGDAEETRLTLHGSVGVKDDADSSSKARATVVLQHGVGFWARREDAGLGGIKGIGERAEKMRANLIGMGSGEGVGYSLQG